MIKGAIQKGCHPLGGEGGAKWWRKMTGEGGVREKWHHLMDKNSRKKGPFFWGTITFFEKKMKSENIQDFFWSKDDGWRGGGVPKDDEKMTGERGGGVKMGVLRMKSFLDGP